MKLSSFVYRNLFFFSVIILALTTCTLLLFLA